MKIYEEFTITNCQSLKKPTIYFWLKSIGLSESYISQLRRQKDSIVLNDNNANLKTQISDGDKLNIANNPTEKTNFYNTNFSNLSIVYEDEDYLIVNKPHNLACIPTKSHYNDNLGAQVCSYMQKENQGFVLRIINRLDKETAGLVVVAKNLFAYKNLSNLQKEYFALCHGNLSSTQMTINKPILTRNINGINIMKREISEEGKQAITHVELIKNFDKYCLVKFHLETGRTHQIRIHMSHINHPLIGDTIYSDKAIDSQIQPTPEHTMLLLKLISFKHFRTNQIISLEINFPEEWKQYLKNYQTEEK